MAFNSNQVIKTLKPLVEILNRHNLKYRFLGSIIPVAINGSLHRQINDLDLLIDETKKELFFNILKELGYKRKPKNFLRISEQMNLYVFEHKELLEISFFAVKFGKMKTILNARRFKFVIDNKAIKRTKYTYEGINFIGIPKDTSYTRALNDKDNPKRIEEFKIYKQHKIKPLVKDYLDVYLGNLKINWGLDLLNFLLTVLGRIRVRFGLSYDFWR